MTITIVTTKQYKNNPAQYRVKHSSKKQTLNTIYLFQNSIIAMCPSSPKLMLPNKSIFRLHRGLCSRNEVKHPVFALQMTLFNSVTSISLIQFRRIEREPQFPTRKEIPPGIWGTAQEPPNVDGSPIRWLRTYTNEICKQRYHTGKMSGLSSVALLSVVGIDVLPCNNILWRELVIF